MIMSLSTYAPHGKRDPKLGIKSSLTEVKESVCWLILFYLSSPDSSEIIPFSIDANDPSKLALDPEVRLRILENFQESGVDEELFKNLVTDDKCPLLDKQIEALIVAFELIYPLAIVRFTKDGMPSSNERTGRERFPKTFEFSGGLRSLTSPYQVDRKRYLEFLCIALDPSKLTRSTLNKEEYDRYWENFTYSLLTLSFRALYRTGDVVFDTAGLYKTLLEGGVCELSADEPKGSLRILKRAIDQKLFPGLVIDGRKIQLGNNGDVSRIKNAIHQELISVDLANVNNPQITRTVEPVQSGSDSNDDENRNVILYGVPGSGKSHLVESDYAGANSHVERVVFHPDYQYANFVGQILPVVSAGDVSYSYVPGPFTSILKRALENPQQRHVLVLEELNRGNAAAIFGDIFQLLDRTSTGESRYGIRNSDIASAIYGNPDEIVKIPRNLFIIATMNTADQNVFTLDTAFQRRWNMKIVPNDLEKVPFADKSILDTSITWRQFVERLNSVILESSGGLTSSEDKRIGAYFISERDISTHSLEEASGRFSEKVIKYLWDDAFRFDRSRIFRDADSSSLEDVVKRFKSATKDDRWGVTFNDFVFSTSDIQVGHISGEQTHEQDSSQS